MSCAILLLPSSLPIFSTPVSEPILIAHLSPTSIMYLLTGSNIGASVLPTLAVLQLLADLYSLLVFLGPPFAYWLFKAAPDSIPKGTIPYLISIFLKLSLLPKGILTPLLS